MEKDCLTIVFSSQKLHHYMLGHHIKLISKVDPLKYLISRTSLPRCMAKWVMLLSKFAIEYVDCKEIKGKEIVDQLADAPRVNAYPLVTEFPNEGFLKVLESNTWTLYFNGSYTHNGVGEGILFVTPQGDYILKSFRLKFPCKKSIVEYEALIINLRIIVQWNITHLCVFGDSQHIFKQVKYEFQTNDDKLLPYKFMVDDFKKYFTHIQFERTLRV